MAVVLCLPFFTVWGKMRNIVEIMQWKLQQEGKLSLDLRGIYLFEDFCLTLQKGKDFLT